MHKIFYIFYKKLTLGYVMGIELPVPTKKNKFRISVVYKLIKLLIDNNIYIN